MTVAVNCCSMRSVGGGGGRLCTVGAALELLSYDIISFLIM